MSYIPKTSPLPNEVPDLHLKYLNQAELKVLLVVIRQVLGWIDPKTNKRKRKDWISISFFKRKTGLSHKSISLAISSLIHNNLIVALDRYEHELKTPKERRGQKKIYYSYAPYFRALKRKTSVDMFIDMFTFLPNTKHIHTKKNRGSKEEKSKQVKRLSDRERYQQIIESQGNNNQP